MDPTLLSNINLAFLIIFVNLVLLGLFRISYRYYSYKKENLDVPKLLPRDFWMFMGLALPFAGILFFRTFGINASEEWWYPIWVIGSGLFAIFGVANWVYYEYFKLEK